MSTFTPDNIKKWALLFCDSISTQLKTNIAFKNGLKKEMKYHDFTQYSANKTFVILCENVKQKQPVIITLNYTCITQTTQAFFSNEIIPVEKSTLSTVETFFATTLSKYAIQSFENIGFPIQFIRNELALNLVHPFHDEEPITTYQYEWMNNNHSSGVLSICLSHDL